MVKNLLDSKFSLPSFATYEKRTPLRCGAMNDYQESRGQIKGKLVGAR